MINVETLLARYFIGRGELYHFQGQYVAAKENYENALSKYKAAHETYCDQIVNICACDLCSADIVSAESNMAKLLDDKGDYEEAESHYKQVLDKIQRLPEGKIDTSTVTIQVSVLSSLGVLYHHRWRDYAEAANYYNLSEEISYRRLGELAIETISIRAHQAQLRLDQASDKLEDKEKQVRYKSEVEVLFQDTIRTCEYALTQGVPSSSRILATWVNNIAVMYQLHQKPEQAYENYERVKKLYKDKAWTSHFSYAVLSTNYAKFLQQRSDRKGANIHYKIADDIYRDKNGKFYSFYQVADFLSDYAQFFQEAPNYDTAMKLLEKAIVIYSQQKPCWGHNKLFRALNMYQEYFQRSPFGHVHPDELYKLMLTEYEKYDIEPNPQIANVWYNYASYLARNNHPVQALQYYEKAFTMYNLVLHKYIPDSSFEKNWLRIKHPLILVHGREVQILKEVEQALKDFADISSQASAEHTYKLACETFEGILETTHWLRADFYGGYSRCLDKVDRSARDLMAERAARIRQMYL